MATSVEFDTDREDLPEAVTELTSQGAELRGLVAVDDREERGAFALRVILSVPGHVRPLVLRAEIPGSEPRYPSLTPYLPAAHWEEREIRDLFGILPEGHPDPRRLVLPPDWPDGVHPLRRDFRGPVPTAEPQPFTPRRATGEGMAYLPVGPVHAGIIDSGHFFFSVVGDNVVWMDLQLFWKHRGVEKLLEGKAPEEALHLVSRLSAAHSVSHQTALALAWEGMGGVEVPPRAQVLRTIFLELERLHNHIGDMGALAAGTGFAVASQRGAVLKEKLLRLNEQLTGHRYLFDLLALGGMRRDLPPEGEQMLAEGLAESEEEWRALEAFIEGHGGFQERLASAGVLKGRTARDLGAVGPAARASGLDRDVRRDHPYLEYPHLELAVPLRSEGDVAARAAVRQGEIAASFSLLRQLLSRLPAGPVVSTVKSPPEGSGISLVESPQGAALHWLAAKGGVLDRARLRPAPLANWPLLMEAVRENAIGDFPLINKSFELCYASNDR